MLNNFKAIYDKIEFKNKDKIALGIGVVLIVFLDYITILGFQINSLKNVNRQIAKIAEKQKLVSRDYYIVEDFSQRVVGLRSKALDLNNKILPAEESTLLLEAVDSIASNQHIKILSLTPKSSLQEKSAVKWDEYSFYPFSILINATGGYHALAKFINDIENGKFFLRVQELNIKNNPRDILRHDINMVFTTTIRIRK